MKSVQKLGIYMDHSTAHIIEFSEGCKVIATVLRDFNKQHKNDTLQRNESEMHQKQKEQQQDYYKKLASFIKKLDTVLLFGPTQAKTELFNLIRKNHDFDLIQFAIKATDVLNSKQKCEFVRHYFEKFDNKMQKD